MTHAARDIQTPKALGAPYFPPKSLGTGEAMLRQQMKELEEKFAYLEDSIQQRLDEMFFEIVGARVDSQQTKARTGTRDGEWMEGGR